MTLAAIAHDHVALRWWRVQRTASRVVRAWRYATDRMSEDDAQRITSDCRYLAGWHPLELLSVRSLLEVLAEKYEDHPELERLARDACDRVGDKWNGSGDDASAAEDWASDLVAQYASQDGIVLKLREEEQ